MERPKYDQFLSHLSTSKFMALQGRQLRRNVVVASALLDQKDAGGQHGKGVAIIPCKSRRERGLQESQAR
jgi:hypothetical protein